MSAPSGLTMRQVVEAMSIRFEPKNAPDLNAVIQFAVSGEPPPYYHLSIADGACTFHRGRHPSPQLTIETPADVWLAVSRGEMSGQDALLEGRYKAEGDLGLLMRFKDLFPARPPGEAHVPTGQRPPGPIRFGGMAWMNVAFAPWMYFWILFETSSLGVALIPPLVFSIGMVAYRRHYRFLPLLETGTLAFFLIVALLAVLDAPKLESWGSVFSSVFMGGLWLGSVAVGHTPLSSEYSKWDLDKRVWKTTLFLHPNAVISLMWGWQFQISAALGLTAELVAGPYHTPLVIARYLLLVPATIFTKQYPKGSPTRGIVDPDRSLDRLRLYAAAGLAFALALCITAAATL